MKPLRNGATHRDECTIININCNINIKYYLR